MELNLNRKIIKVKFEGEEYKVRAPSNAELKKFMEDEAEGNDLDKSIRLLGQLGLPEEISWELDPESLQQVIEAITPQPKKS